MKSCSCRLRIKSAWISPAQPFPHSSPPLRTPGRERRKRRKRPLGFGPEGRDAHGAASPRGRRRQGNARRNAGPHLGWIENEEDSLHGRPALCRPRHLLRSSKERQRHHAYLHLRHPARAARGPDRKSTRLNSSHLVISYAVFCLKKKKKKRK